MKPNVHELAQQLLTGQLHDLEIEEQNWLRSHLQECALCRSYSEAIVRVGSALRFQAITADVALVETTRLRVRLRSRELQALQNRRWLVCISCLAVGLSTAITTPLLWRTLAWIGLWARISSWFCLAIFAVLWIAPALVVASLLLVRGTYLSTHE